MSNYTIWPCDCRTAMSLMGAESVDSIVTDPPYGLSKEPDVAEVMRHWLAGDDYAHKSAGFMNAKWDSFVPGPAVWREAYRALKPGGHLVAFFGTRTYDLGVMALRLAGFEVRDQLAWVFGSGFPKSHDVSKGIDRAMGAERTEVVGSKLGRPGMSKDGSNQRNGFDSAFGGESSGIMPTDILAPATPEAAAWAGWGTALKPAYEPIVLCRKPLSERTVAANVLRWGTGAVNIDGCRIGTESTRRVSNAGTNGDGWGMGKSAHVNGSASGRWPANLAHDGSPEVLAGFPNAPGQQGDLNATGRKRPSKTCFGDMAAPLPHAARVDDSKSAARFFYCAKASKADRNRGLDDMPEQASAASQFRPNHTAKAAAGENGNPYGRWSPVRNTHPTVKPTALMQWLCRLITPPGGTVLDPFMGSGSTGVAAMLEHMEFIGCEMTDEYIPIATARIDNAVRTR